MTRFARTIAYTAGACTAGAMILAAGPVSYASASDKPVADKPVADKRAVEKPADSTSSSPQSSKKLRVKPASLSAGGKAGAEKPGKEKTLQARAMSGDAEAQFFMGRMYHVGKGVKQNPETAIDWFERAAKGRLAAAHYSIGLIRLTGEIGAPDIVEAYARFRVAARGGDVRAAALLFYVGAKMNGAEIRKSDIRYQLLVGPAPANVDAKAARSKK